ncbi:amidinotransferase [Methanoculleus sp. FWC-SCC1]|uniref:Amidinotransferase n=1 Tax=Methanoculleus frigidifontis TaxID=2584085 RepID=A0ABT8M9W6_9EURY|nr:arginine deiminase family protein [Methanoculleus sp. FWC-SCC1]MDN7024720.1 amidinotransferase [Methanoculleus sp. FWC-SCC1]
MLGRVRAEWERARTVVVHRPGMEMFFGLLEPYEALYERAFSRYEARREHEQLEYVLGREFGATVMRLKETVLDAADRDPVMRRKLIELAHETIAFSGDPKEVTAAREMFFRNADALDSQHFFTILLMHPLIEMGRGGEERGIRVDVTGRQPLANLYFMRDQQAVTPRGVVVSRMAKHQRRREPQITRLLWQVLDLPVFCEVQEPGTLEGGDYMPMGTFALLGLGNRTDRAGIEQFLASDPGFDEVAIVHQPGHPLIPTSRPDPMIDMHLDTYFNVASSGVVIGSELLLKGAEVEVCHRTGPGAYECSLPATNLYDYIREKGFAVIGLSTLEQLSYAPNVLCVRDGTILTVEGERIMKTVLKNLERKAATDPERYGRLLYQAQQDYRRIRTAGQFFPHKKEIYQHDIEAYPVMLENLTGGYGGPHCMTCVLERG